MQKDFPLYKKKVSDSSPQLKNQGKQGFFSFLRSPTAKNKEINSDSQRDMAVVQEKKSKFSSYQRFINSIQEPKKQPNYESVSNQLKIVMDSPAIIKQERFSKFSVVNKQFQKDSFQSSQDRSILQQSNLKGIDSKKEIPRHIDIQKEMYIQRNYLTPQAEFFNRPNSIKSTKNNDVFDDKGSFPSSRPKKKVKNKINQLQQQHAYFQNVQKLKKTQSEDTMDRLIGDHTNETTVKLRKSISSFNQNNKSKLQIVIPNKEHRAGSHYNSQVERPFISDPCESEKKPNKEEQKLKTIIRNQYTPSLVERNLGKKINLTRRVPFISEIDNYEYEQDFNPNQTNQDHRSHILPSRQRIFSTKTSQKNGLIQQHFQQPNRNPNEDSREILLNLQQKQRPIQKVDPKLLNQSISIDFHKDKPTTQVSSFQKGETNFVMDSPTDKLSGQIQVSYKFPELSPIQDELSSSPLKRSDRNGTKNSLVKSNELYYQGKPKIIPNEKILDLLLLSTGELKNIFNKEGKIQQKPQQIPKIVKFVQHNQRFPDDFFNAINK